jgi:hypothetical protein
MRTDTDPQEKALRIAERQVESLNFDIDANRRQMVVDIERHHELMQRREMAVRLLRMLGGEAAAYAPGETG